MACRCEDILRVETLPDPCASGLCVGQQAQVADALYELVYDPLGDCGRSWKLLADGGTGSINVQDEGVLVGTRPTLNFVGPGVTATDDPPNNRVDITIPGAANTIGVEDEGALVGTRPTINFIGAGVTAVDNGGSNRVDVTIPAAPNTIAVQDEGVLAGTRPTINFIGAGVTAVDNGGSNRVDVTIPGATDTAWKAFTGRVILGGGATTKYLCDNWNDASDSPLQYPVPVASRVTMMYVRVRENQANVVTHVNLLKNGVQQAQVNFNATVTGNGDTGAISIAYAAGDYFDVQVVTGGNGGDNVRLGVTLVFEVP